MGGGEVVRWWGCPHAEVPGRATFTTSFDLLKWNSCLVSSLQRQNNVKVNDDDEDEESTRL